jgi:hypothetical protein
MGHNSENLFYEASSHIGGPVDPIYTTTDAGALMNDYRHIADLSLPGTIYFNFVGSTDINAFALLYRGHDFIGIHFGAVIGLYELFHSMLAHKQFARDIGDPGRLSVDFSELRRKIVFLKDGGGGSSNFYWGVIASADPMRRSYANALFFCALDFILHHELSHILLGHLDYLRGRGTTELIERRVHDQRLWTTEISQACEVDADLMATAVCLDRLRKFHSLRPRSEPPADWISVLQDTAIAYRVWYTAISMLLIVFGVGGEGIVDGSNGSHPHPYLRDCLILDRGLSSVREVGQASESSYRAGIEKATADIPTIWKGIFGANFIESYMGYESSALQQEWSLLMNRIRPQLRELIGCRRPSLER